MLRSTSPSSSPSAPGGRHTHSGGATSPPRLIINDFETRPLARGVPMRSPAARTAGESRSPLFPGRPQVFSCPPWRTRSLSSRFYGDIVLHSLNEAARRALEAMMKGYEYQSDFAKKYVALGRDQGRGEGEVAANA